MLNRIKLASVHDVKDLAQLLDEVTLNLQEKGIDQWTYPHNISEIEIDVVNGNVYKVIRDSKIIGTFSLKNVNNEDFPVQERDSRYLYRIAVSPKYQGKKIGLEIIDYVKKYSRRLDLTIYLDCWAGNNKLRNFYICAGFTFVGNFPEKNYMISVFKWQKV